VEVDGTPGEWIGVTGKTGDTVILYLHGGGYVIGSINSHRELISRIARAAGARALAIDYRLAPEHPFPAAVEDATKAYRWLLKQGVAPEKIVIAGDSAGGGLTAATLLALRDAGDRLPAAAVCISPWTDLTISGETMVTKADVDPMIRPDDAFGAARYHGRPTNHRRSPIFAGLSGLPPLRSGGDVRVPE
jgi:acetyl esterase/lipase